MRSMRLDRSQARAKCSSRARARAAGIAASSGASSGPCSRPVSAARSGVKSAAPDGRWPYAPPRGPATTRAARLVDRRRPRQPSRRSPRRHRARRAQRRLLEGQRLAEHHLLPQTRVLGQHHIRQHRRDERLDLRGRQIRGQQRLEPGARLRAATAIAPIRSASDAAAPSRNARWRAAGARARTPRPSAPASAARCRALECPSRNRSLHTATLAIAGLAQLAHARRAVALGQRRAIGRRSAATGARTAGSEATAPRASAAGAGCCSGDRRRAARA